MEENEGKEPGDYLGVARYYQKLGDFDKASSFYSKALELDSGLPDAYFNRGLCRISKNEFKDAIDDLEEAIRLRGDFPEAREALAGISAGQKKPNRSYDKKVNMDESMKTESSREEDKFNFLEKPSMDYSDVAGLNKTKEIINEAIVYPLKNPELAKKYGRSVGGGILFYGPPGCGKTFIGKATAGECNAVFLNVKISDIMDKYVGNTEKNLHTLFSKARANTPSIIFFDEIDGIGGRRDANQQSFEKRAINQFLIEMDGVEDSNEGVLIIGSTNAPWGLDPALRRSGRFSKTIYFPEPDKRTRTEVFKLVLKGKPIEKRINYGRLARLTEGYSIADIEALCNEACAIPWKEALRTGKERNIKMRDFIRAFGIVKSSLPTWYNSVKKYVISQENQDSEGKGKSDTSGVIVVKHKRAQEELLDEEERKVFKDLVRSIHKHNNLNYKARKDMRVWFAKNIF